jgi:hypothetical protein
MRERWPVTIADDDGEEVEVGPGTAAPATVYIRTSPGGVLLDADQRERLAQAIVAASHEAERRDARPATDPPLHSGEGITGMYWDNLGSVGDA